jgi:hypothetical protein
MCFGPEAPAVWFAVPETERARRAELSTDQCVIDDEHFFVRARLEIPVHGLEESFCWLVWVSLSSANFERASELWYAPGRETEPSYFGWLSSALPGYPDTLNLKANVHTRPVGQRPFVELAPTDHPLAIEQRNGISRERLQQIMELALHGHAS